MKSSYFSTIWLAGIAIFSMFFGAGNVIFPLKVGLLAGDKIPFAMAGLFLTAIGGPILGLVGVTLYRGNCREFFCRPGRDYRTDFYCDLPILARTVCGDSALFCCRTFIIKCDFWRNRPSVVFICGFQLCLALFLLLAVSDRV